MRADPTSPLRWTTKSTRKLADELTRQGRRVSAGTVADLLRAEGFNLHANAIDGAPHRRPDNQFRSINEQARRHIDAGQPVISVDTRKRRLPSRRTDVGHRWQLSGPPATLTGRDFADSAILREISGGAPNASWVDVGGDHDTATFAVALVRRWWRILGHQNAVRLLITANIGGSGGDRAGVWKAGLAAFAAETGLDVTICHLPPGTSKWSGIEHRLACHVATSWRGRPLTSLDIVVNSIGRTPPAPGGPG